MVFLKLIFNLGTWSKKSSIVNGRRPFRKDPFALDYDYDSEAEWQEEDDGESIECSDSDMEEEEDDEGSDCSWVVPDGYLSEGEGLDVPPLPDELDPFYDPGIPNKKKKSIRELSICILGPNFLPLLGDIVNHKDPWENLEQIFQ